MRLTISRAIAAPLVGTVVAWALVVLAQYSDLFIRDVFDDGIRVGSNPAVAVSTYLVFLAVAVPAMAALWSQRVAIRERIARGPQARLERAAHRFVTLVLVVSMALAAIIAIGTFIEGFVGPEQRPDLLVRLGNVYAPILLYTALVLTVLLVGFVFRTDSLPKSSDPPPDNSGHTSTRFDAATPGTADNASRAEARRDLGAAYAIPIVASALALIVGLIVYDATGNSLEVWVWVAIQFLIGVGIVAGTAYGERAIATGPTETSSRSRITLGARRLSFVLSIVFAAVVGIMGFGFGSSAIDSLRSQPFLSVEAISGPNTSEGPVEVALNGGDLDEGSSITLTVEPSGETLLSETISADEFYYHSVELENSLAAGDYSLVAEATSRDGRSLVDRREFFVDDTGAVSWDMQKASPERWSETNTVIAQPDLRWWLEDLLPAFVLVVLSLGVVHQSLIRRNDPEDAVLRGGSSRNATDDS